MATKIKFPDDIKWATRQRLQYIEVMAYYTGAVSRSDVARAFGISDAAATKDLKLYGELAPANLIYSQKIFGFVPGVSFEAVFTDLSPDTALAMIAANLPTAGGPLGEDNLYGICAESLPLPRRFPPKAVLAGITRGIKMRRQVSVVYQSLTDRESQTRRIIEPHALINTGLRWHVRAYNRETYDFRDFVLSRFSETEMLENPAESGMEYDDDWVEFITLRLAPHPELKQHKQASLITDYGMSDGELKLRVRRALLGYMLKSLSVDTTADHSMNPNSFQLVILNREEIEPFAGWALD